MTRYATQRGSYHIDALTGQPQIGHCHSFFVRADLRGQGFAHELKAHQVGNLTAEHFDYGLSTVDGSNHAQKNVLIKAGFRYLDQFPNTKTGGTTELWGLSISTIQDK